MAFLPGVFNKIANAVNPPAPPAAPAGGAPAAGGSAGPATAQKDAPANPGANPGNMNSGGNNQPAGGPEPSKLDAFADLFTPKKVDPNAPKVPTLADPLLTPLDPTAFREQVASTNFAASVPPEVLQKAASGDTTALMEAMNIVSREAFSAATQLSHGLVEHGARTAAERVNGSLDGRIRQNLIRTQNTTNETLAKPSVAPIFGAVKAQIALHNPQLSAEQVQKHAEEYFMEMSNELTAPQRQAEQTKQAEASKPAGTNFAFLLDPNS